MNDWIWLWVALALAVASLVCFWKAGRLTVGGTFRRQKTAVLAGIRLERPIRVYRDKFSYWWIAVVGHVGPVGFAVGMLWNRKPFTPTPPPGTLDDVYEGGK